MPHSYLNVDLKVLLKFPAVVIALVELRIRWVEVREASLDLVDKPIYRQSLYFVFKGEFREIGMHTVQCWY